MRHNIMSMVGLLQVQYVHQHTVLLGYFATFMKGLSKAFMDSI